MVDDIDPTTTSDAGSGGTAADGAAPRPRRRKAAVREPGPPAPVQPPSDGDEAPAAEAGDAPAPAKRTRARKTAASKPAADESAAAGTGAAADGEPAAKPARKRTKKTAAAAPEAAEETTAEAPAAPVVPLVVFQPPDADQPPARRRRTRTAAADAEPTAPEATAEGGATTETTAQADDGEPREGETAEEAAERTARRRRRGRRGRGGKGRGGAAGEADESTDGEATATDEDSETAADEAATDEGGEGEEGGTGTRRRRRRRRRGGGGGGDDGNGAEDEGVETVVHVREPRAKRDEEVRGVTGSTRLEAKRQRRREVRDSGRRRPPVITEAEFLARREAVERVMVVRQGGDRTQIAVLEDGVLVEHYVQRQDNKSYVGNVYLGKVQNVLPSMEAAFVDIGRGRNAVLYAGEVNYDASQLEGRPPRIEQALKSGQAILTQVTKDPIGHKGARLTNQVSLPGRYMVYVPEGKVTGISRKLPDTERTRLKNILKKLTPEDAGVIIRTAAEGASEEELTRDLNRLKAQWETIQKKSSTATAPELIYAEPDLVLRVIRDVFNEDFSELVVQGDDEWDTVDNYLSWVAPDLAKRARKWVGGGDVFAEYRVDEQIAKGLDRKVWLPSGGYLIIDRTEAMIVVDVNTGKFTGKGGNLEETVTKNNLEAAEEIVRQMRLRDLGGIIVVDFIDMVLESNRELVLRRLMECLGRDRTKHQVAEVTSLGLVQMTRKRVGQGLLDAFSETCDCCNGRGVKITIDPFTPPAATKQERGGGGGGRKRGKGGPADVAAASAKSRSNGDEAGTADAAVADGGAPDGAASDGGAPDGAASDGGAPDGARAGGEDHGSAAEAYPEGASEPAEGLPTGS